VNQDFDDIFDQLLNSLEISEPYEGTRSQAEALYRFTATTISEYIQKTTLLAPPGDQRLGIDPVYRLQVDLLKEMTWCYVINNPGLAAHQHGQRRAIRTLFEVFNEAAERKKWALFPALYREEAIELTKQLGTIPPARRARLVADTIAAMTDQQALKMYQRLTGVLQGSVLDPIVS
jgi:dGTPase